MSIPGSAHRGNWPQLQCIWANTIQFFQGTPILRRDDAAICFARKLEEIYPSPSGVRNRVEVSDGEHEIFCPNPKDHTNFRTSRYIQWSSSLYNMYTVAQSWMLHHNPLHKTKHATAAKKYTRLDPKMVFSLRAGAICAAPTHPRVVFAVMPATCTYTPP